jgi:hypothetical protein
MEAKEGLLRIGIPTGLGPKGVRKEAVDIAKAMLTQMGAKYINKRYTKYYVPENPNLDNGHFDTVRWGVVLSTEVPDVEYARSIMLSFDYDNIQMLDSEKRNLHTYYNEKPYLRHNQLYNYKK